MASDKSNAGEASVSPNLRVTPPIAILEFANLALAIEPANCAFVTVPERLLVAKEPSKVVAVTTPVMFIFPVPLIVLLLRSKLPPHCGVVSSTTLEIPLPETPVRLDPSP